MAVGALINAHEPTKDTVGHPEVVYWFSTLDMTIDMPWARRSGTYAASGAPGHFDERGDAEWPLDKRTTTVSFRTVVDRTDARSQSKIVGDFERLVGHGRNMTFLFDRGDGTYRYWDGKVTTHDPKLERGMFSSVVITFTIEHADPLLRDDAPGGWLRLDEPGFYLDEGHLLDDNADYFPMTANHFIHNLSYTGEADEEAPIFHLVGPLTYVPSVGAISVVNYAAEAYDGQPMYFYLTKSIPAGLSVEINAETWDIRALKSDGTPDPNQDYYSAFGLPDGQDTIMRFVPGVNPIQISSGLDADFTGATKPRCEIIYVPRYRTV